MRKTRRDEVVSTSERSLRRGPNTRNLCTGDMLLKLWRSRKKRSQSDKVVTRRSPAAAPSSAHEAVPPSSSSSSGSTPTPLTGLGLSPSLEGSTVEEGSTSGEAQAAGKARGGSSPRRVELEETIRPVERAPSEEQAIAEQPRKVLVERNGREYDAPLLSVDGTTTTAAKRPVRRTDNHSHNDDSGRRNVSPMSASQLSEVRDSRSRNTARSYTMSQSHAAEEGDRDPTQIYGKS